MESKRDSGRISFELAKPFISIVFCIDAAEASSPIPIRTASKTFSRAGLRSLTIKDSGAKDSVKSIKMLTLPLTLVKIKTVLNGTHLAPGIFGFHNACSGRHRTKLKKMLLVVVAACNAATAQRTALQQ